MNDSEIRSSLRARLEKTYSGQPETLIVDELGLCSGAVRADLAVVNGSLCAFEIKSDSDTLARLKAQANIYNRVFDQVTLVVGKRHLDAGRRAAPTWWGVQLVERNGTQIRFRVIRAPKTNRSVDGHAIAQLLWRDEAAEILKTLGRLEKISGKPRRVLWSALVETVPLAELRALVRERLRARQLWRSGRRRKLGGGTYRPSAK